MLKNFFEFGNMTSVKAVTILFYVGLAPLIIESYIIGKYIFLTNTYIAQTVEIIGGQKWYTGQEVNNIPLGMFGGVVSFIVLIIMWKIVCELLIIFFRYFEMSTNRD